MASSGFRLIRPKLFLPTASTGFRWIKPQINPLPLPVGQGVGACGMQLIRNITTKPEVGKKISTEGSSVIYISGARLVGNEQAKISLTKIYGIGPKKAVQLCSRLGISSNVKIGELTKYQILQLQQIIGQDHVVHYELKRRVQADIDRFKTIFCYRGIRHQDGLPLRGQRTHTNARTCRKNKSKGLQGRTRQV